MKTFKFLFIFLIIFLSLTSCKNEKTYISPDLQKNGLYGNVSMVINKYDTVIFDIDGQQKKNGDRIVRDEAGYIISWETGTRESENFQMEKYKYDKKYNLIEIEGEGDWTIYSYVRTYHYNNDGDLIKIDSECSGYLEDNWKQIQEYTILKKDRKGNWIKRLCHAQTILSDGSLFSNEEYLEERQIVYID